METDISFAPATELRRKIAAKAVSIVELTELFYRRIEHLNPNGSHTTHHLGPVPERGQVFQCVIPATTWFGACVDANIGYSLVSCAVAPGFDFVR